MGALTLPCSSVVDVLNNQSAVLQQWFSHEPQQVNGLLIRKSECWLEPVEFVSANHDQAFDSARFHLMVVSKRDIWRIQLDLIFYCDSYTKEDGSNAGPGLQFAVLDDNGDRVVIDHFATSQLQPDQAMPAEQFCLYWFSRLFKSPCINRIFAYKEYEAEID
ncbi:hypothetical protein [uncultured Endozoicomonas sp.]|uniref:hypothetical protein n=1 Tax=uncultured Endozoicomonas sp. TaxID=432652 RepID=UPI00263A37D1|nr:hypothetical protein [uncultured Endozoicomonas sp.]